jgi:hypothetical protein
LIDHQQALTQQGRASFDRPAPLSRTIRAIVIQPNLEPIARLFRAVIRMPSTLQLPKHQLQVRLAEARLFAQPIGSVVCFFEQAAHLFGLLRSVDSAMVSEIIEAAARGDQPRRRL